MSAEYVSGKDISLKLMRINNVAIFLKVKASRILYLTNQLAHYVVLVFFTDRFSVRDNVSEHANKSSEKFFILAIIKVIHVASYNIKLPRVFAYY